MTSPFIPGLELSRLYFTETVRPLIEEEFPGIAYAAGLLGWGSEVLGYDSQRSTDHNWGPRCLVFVDDAGDGTDACPGATASRAPAERIGAGMLAADGLAARVSAMFSRRLPATFRGRRTVFPASDAPRDQAGHWVQVTGLGNWLTAGLGFDPRCGVELIDWLSAPTQRLAEVTEGAVFHDGLGIGQGAPRPESDHAGLGALGAARAALAWYPRDIWRYVLACQWQRISQEEAFPGRCAEAGDELGSAVVAGRLARDLMRLVLLMQRRYPPYSKWLGTAFARAHGVTPGLRRMLTGAVLAGTWPDRERNLCGAYEAVARMHNALNLTPPVDVATRPFYDRPYQVLDAGRFAEALRHSIGAAEIRRLPLTGAVDQFVDSTDAAHDPALTRAAVSVVLSR